MNPKLERSRAKGWGGVVRGGEGVLNLVVADNMLVLT